MPERRLAGALLVAVVATAAFAPAPAAAEDAPAPPPASSEPAEEKDEESIIGIGFGGLRKLFPWEQEGEGGEVRDPYVAVYEWATQSLMGYAAVRGFTHLHGEDAFGRRDLRKNRLEGEVRLQYKRRPFDGPIAVIAEVDLRADDDDYMDEPFQRPYENKEGRPVVNLNDLYIITGAGPVDLRLGFQTIGWGTADLDNPTDNLNPRDLTDIFDSRKIGVLAARADYYLWDFEVQGIWIPFFIASRLPPEGKRFSTPDPPLAGLPVELEFTRDHDYPRHFPEGSQYALKVSRSIAGFDLSASYYNGLNKIPVARVFAQDFPPAGPGLPPKVRIDTELHYERIEAWGGDFATTLGWLPLGDAIRKVQLHGEGAFVDSRRSSGDDYVRYAIGANYTLNNVLFEHDVVVLVDYIDEIEVRERRRTGVEGFASRLSPPFQALVAPLIPALGEIVTEQTRLARQTRGSLASRVSYQVSSNFKVETTFFLKMRGRDNQFVRPEVIWDMTDNVQLATGFDIFSGKTGTFFGNYDGDDRFFWQVKVSF